ncbi:aminoglycoside phosphotransferase family protein [Nocardia sp. NPDC019395]|uniref:aminoglycoside phosphotransferase family protein n=1 Tax=Nocardia sp. NPDC019395 TaxID=3154686 RepID=UPI0033D08DEA
MFDLFEVPEKFAHRLIADTGEPGRTWLASLPGRLGELLKRWRCHPDGPVLHGRVGVVLPVRRAGLPPAVVKVSFPGYADRYEADAYAAWDGAGTVRLYARDDENHAMLLERASTRTLADIDDPAEALAVQGRLSRLMSIPAPAGLPRLSDSIGDWEQEIRTASASLGNPLPNPVLDTAIATLHDLGPDQPGTLVHGDLHDANILAADREPWLAIDPKVYVGDPAYEALNVILSPRFGPVLASADPAPMLDRYLDIYCTAAGLNRDRARRWTQLGAVRESLQGRRDGEPEWLIRAFDTLGAAFA